jgi:hypothetical protein
MSGSSRRRECPDDPGRPGGILNGIDKLRVAVYDAVA